MGSKGTFKQNGIPIRTQTVTRGNSFYVCNATAVSADRTGVNDAGSGYGSISAPFSTIDYAINQCVASQGDEIHVLQGHNEAITTASITADIAGISIIGHGHGSMRPRIDFTHADGKVVVSAANVLIKNINFHANVTIVTIGLDIQAGGDNCNVENCLFDVETTTTDEFLITINRGVVTGGGIYNCVIDMGLGGAAHGIKLVGANTGCDIVGNVIKGDYSTACIGGITTLSTEVLIKDNILMNGGPGNIGAVACVVMLTGTTGYVVNNHTFCNVATIRAHYTADTMFFSGNRASEDVGDGADSIITGDAVSVVATADD